MMRDLKSLPQRFIRDLRGVAAIEFVILAPIMIVMFLGVAELGLALLVNRKVITTAFTIGDLTARDDVVSNNELNNIFRAGELSMRPYPETTLSMRISTIQLDSSNNALVRESCAQGDFSPLATNSTVTPPPGLLLAEDDSFILAEVEYGFTSAIASLNPSGVWDLGNTFRQRPRQGLLVDLPNNC
ncbi:MAG: TadE/TadG family type IV pilus assembly protein [Maricaulaceae bacterium]